VQNKKRNTSLYFTDTVTGSCTFSSSGSTSNSSPNGARDGFMMMTYSNLSPEVSNILKEHNIKQKDIEKHLDYLFARSLSEFTGWFDNVNQVGEPDYVKYQIDGHNTSSAVFGFTLRGETLAGLLDPSTDRVLLL
jgi:hypothetical protein